MLVREGRKWVLYTSDGSRVLGTHPTREAAMRQETAIRISQQARKNPFELSRMPPPWETSAFEPYISDQTMITHTQTLHQGYVDKLNSRFGNSDLLSLPPSDVLNNPSAFFTTEGDKQFYIDMMGGNLCHILFWQILNPNGTTRSTRDLEKALGVSTGSICKRIVDLGVKRVGSGWVWGALNNRNQFVMYSTKNHNTPYMRLQTPLFCVDVWEHAYFLDQLADRKAYMENIVSFLDFSVIADILGSQLEGVDPIDAWVLGR